MSQQPEGATNGLAHRTSLKEEDVTDENITGGQEGLDDNAKKLIVRFVKSKHTVEKDAVVDIIAEKQMERNSFCTLPFTIFFFVVYTLAMLQHENVGDSGMVQREMTSMLEGTTYEGVQFTSGHKDMGDIDTKEDIYNYWREAVLPLFINPLSGPREDLHRALRYNMVIGGVVLQQMRREDRRCSQEYPKLGPFANDSTNPLLQNFSCYPWTSEDRSCFGAVDKQLVNGRARMGWCPDQMVFQTGRRLEFVPDGGGTGGASKGANDPTRSTLFSVNMYEFEGIGRAIEKVTELENEGWIDYQTSWVGVQILVLNPDLGIFVHVTMNVYMPPSGAMLPKVSCQSFQPEPYQFKAVMALDGLYVLCVLWLTFSVARNLFRYCKESKGSDYLKDPWNILDCTTVGCSYIVIILWMQLLVRLSDVKEKAMAARALEPLPGQTSEQYPQAVADLHEELRDTNQFLQSWRIMLCWYTLLVAMKFLESFANQPRLAVVTKTITRAGTDLFHFALVMLAVFMAFCVSGMLLFGRRLHEFSSEQWSINTCFLMMLGDFTYDDLAREHPVTTAVWFWVYIAVMMLLMLNMLMAIIMDVYTEVKGEASEFAPVWTQIQQICSHAWNVHKGRTVSNSDMLQLLSDMPEEEIDVADLMKKAGPSLSMEQASALIEDSRTAMENKLNSGVTMSDAMQMVAWTKTAVQKIGKKLDKILQSEEEQEQLFSGQPSPENETDPNISGEAHKAYVADAADAIDGIEQRFAKIDAFMKESLQYSTFRGKDLKNRLAVIEDMARKQRDIVNDSSNLWDHMPKLGGSQAGVDRRVCNV
jgi:hypothetical protein